MEEETERRLAEKVDFFKELHIYDYDCLPTESENDDEATAFLISYGRSQSPKLTPNPGTDVGSRHHHGISRTLAAALPTLESPSIQNANLLGITVDAHSKTVAGTSDIKLISSADPIDDRRKIKPRGSSKAMTKRKRGKSVEMKPESEQIFKGKLFCMLLDFSTGACVLMLRQTSYQTTIYPRHALFGSEKHANGEQFG